MDMLPGGRRQSVDRSNPYVSPETATRRESQATRKNLAVFGIVLVGAALVLLGVWALPVAGFHHAYIVGIFGWLFVNGEDPDPNSIFFFGGREYVPTLWGLPINLAVTAGLAWCVWRCSRLVKKPKTSATRHARED